MIRVSNDFVKAVYSMNPSTRILFKFGDTILTNEDIDLSQGVKVMEPLNLQEELTIGACPSATLDTTIMNQHGLLSDFEFGECEVSLSVRTNMENKNLIEANATTTMRYDSGSDVIFSGYINEPYLTVNGAATTAQPPFPVYSILTVDNTVYCISKEGEIWTALWVDGEIWNTLSNASWNDVSKFLWDNVQGVLIPFDDINTWNSLSSYIWDEMKDYIWGNFVKPSVMNEFMTNKLKGWAKNLRGMSFDGNILHEFYPSGLIEKYEYAKLGVFIVDTPKKRRINLISISSLDRMRKFDTIADDFLDSLVYPKSLESIFSDLCNFVGVPRATISFMNSSRIFNEAPMRTENVSAREVLGWIAEASCSYARMTRDGEVELTWFGVDNTTIPMNQYFSIDIAEFEVSKIDKLQIAGTETDIGAIIGEGVNGYQIMDNPYLYGANDTEIRILGVPIYNRLTNYESFSPIVANAVCDWSIQAGDIIKIELKGKTYRLPIYSQIITWNGGFARVSYESTGTESRLIMSMVNRRLFQQRRKTHEITVNVDGISSKITGVEGNVHDLNITVDGISSNLQNIEGNVSNLKYAIDGFSLEYVTKDGVISAINLTPELAKIIAERITLEGIVTVNEKFKILKDGSMVATDGTFSGHLTAKSGTIGGFLIEDDRLSNGNNIVLSSSGYVRLGKLTITDDPSFGPVFRGDGGIVFIVNGSIYGVFANNAFTIQVPVEARYGLFLNPSRTTNMPANAYIDPYTGELFRTTNTSGGGGVTPPVGNALYATVDTNKASAYEGDSVTVTCAASGGTTPYTYTFYVSKDGGSFNQISGSGSSRAYTMSTAGSYVFSFIVKDNASNTYQAYSNPVVCERKTTAMNVRVDVNTTSVSVGGLVTFTLVLTGGVGPFRYFMELGKDGALFDNTEGSRVVSYTLTQPGIYQMRGAVVDDGAAGYAYAVSPNVTVISANQYVTTTGVNVYVRSGPGTSYSIVGTIVSYGTQVQITGGPSGGFYQIWWSGGSLSGWVSGSYLSI